MLIHFTKVFHLWFFTKMTIHVRRVCKNWCCAVGPSVLEVFNTLLKHLRISVDKDISATQSPDEKNFQEAIINTIGTCRVKHMLL